MTSRFATGGSSKALNGHDLSPHVSTPMGLVRAASILLGRFPESKHDFGVLGSRLAKAVKRRKNYDSYYIKSIWRGSHSASKPISRAIDNLISELAAKPPDKNYRKVMVLVPNGVHVPKKTVILRDATTCICGVSFIPTIWNQINHTRACAFMRLKMRRKK